MIKDKYQIKVIYPEWQILSVKKRQSNSSLCDQYKMQDFAITCPKFLATTDQS